MRVSGLSSSGGGSSFPPSGTLNIASGGPGNAAALLFSAVNATWEELSAAANITGDTLYLNAFNSSPYLRARIENHTTGIITLLTLSGFGTFTSSPDLHILGYDQENDQYWVVFDAVGGSGSLTAGVLYPLTVSGSTITLGAGVTPPAIAGKTVQRFGCVNNGKIVIIYQDNVNFRYDTARVYDMSGASWAAPIGGTTSPYGANTIATSDAATTNESYFSSGAQNNKGFWSFSPASGVTAPCFIEFNFSTETFTDRTAQIPLDCDSSPSNAFSMALDPLSNYAIGYFRTSLARYIFFYDTSLNSRIAIWPCNNSTFFKLLAGDLSAGVLCRVATDIGTSFNSIKSSYVNVSGVGTLAGIECIGNEATNNNDYGADGMAFLFNIDGAGWIVNPSTPSLWQRGGYKQLMQAYSTSLECMNVQLPFVGTYESENPAQIYYTN